MPNTITYSEKNKGWTSFASYIPEAICNLNNRLFTIKNGQLYLHNDKDNPIRNNFYGEQFVSKVKTVINEAPGQDKIFKNLILEGNKTWNVSLKTNYSESNLLKEEFNQRESRYFAYLRKNEDENDLHGFSAQGIGVIQSFLGLNISFEFIPESINVGDRLYQLNGAVNEFIGIITNLSDGILTVDAITTTPVNGYFCFAKKSSRIEGSEMRGYYLEIELENNDTEAVELFAIETNVSKSFI